jgi:hypothetical protein
MVPSLRARAVARPLHAPPRPRDRLWHERDQLAPLPHAVRDPGRHGGRHPERLVHAAEVVVHKVQRDGVLQVDGLLAEGVREPRKAPVLPTPRRIYEAARPPCRRRPRRRFSSWKEPVRPCEGRRRAPARLPRARAEAWGMPRDLLCRCARGSPTDAPEAVSSRCRQVAVTARFSSEHDGTRGSGAG